MRKLQVGVLAILCAGTQLFTGNASAQLPTKISSFPLHEVRLLDSPFKHAEDLDVQYLLGLSADRLLAPYLKEAGLKPKAPNYPNWESTGLDGHIGGHYLSALSLMYAATGNHQIKERLDYVLSELKKCQDAAGDGYLCGVPEGKAMWQDIAAGKIQAGGFDLNKKWVPLYNIHKIYAGLRDAYLQAGSKEARDMLIKLTDWAIRLVSNLSEAQIQDMLRSEHGGLNEVFADVAAITGNKKYLELARQFSHQVILNPLLEQKDVLNGMHANTQIPKVIGFERVAEVEGNQDWYRASAYFWETVVKNRSVSIGGNSAFEHFHPADNFTRMIEGTQGPETCNTYNMLRLTKMLYQVSGDESYMEFYERALYNHILSTIDPVQGGFVYFTPMRSGHYRVYSQPQTSFWCCVGSGIENHAKYGEMIYAHSRKDVYVNLFIPSRLQWKEGKLELIQENTFPESPSTELTVNPHKQSAFTLYLRYPEWVKNGEIKVTINGQLQTVTGRPGSYIALNREWKKGDKVRMEMPMHLMLNQLPDQSASYSIQYGPIVLAARTGTEDLIGLFADDSRGGHVANGRQIPLQEMPVIVGTPEEILTAVAPVPGKPLTFTLSGLKPEKYETMELIPFYRLHESRYMIYWSLISPAEYQEKQEQLAARERERAALEAITNDYIICGEQQPESDHFIQSEGSRTGITQNIHWRESRNWFSYQMKSKEKNATRLLFTYCAKESAGRSFIILAGGKKIAEVAIPKDAKDDFATYTCAIPQDLGKEKQLEIRFEAAPDSRTARICEIRLLSE